MIVHSNKRNDMFKLLSVICNMIFNMYHIFHAACLSFHTKCNLFHIPHNLTVEAISVAMQVMCVRV